MVRICEGVTFTPADPPPPVRRRRRRSGPVRTSQVTPTPPGPVVDAAQHDALRRAVSAEATLAVLGGGAPEVALREAVRSGAAGGSEQALVTMLDGGWSRAEALAVAWRHPDAEPSRLVTLLLRRYGMTVAEMLTLLAEIGVDGPTRLELLGLDR